MFVYARVEFTTGSFVTVGCEDVFTVVVSCSDVGRTVVKSDVLSVVCSVVIVAAVVVTSFSSSGQQTPAYLELGNIKLLISTIYLGLTA